MRTNKILSPLILCGLMLTASGLTSQAQTTASYIGPASGGEWNTPANWDTGAPPLDSTTNAVIATGTNVYYNLPMSAASFGSLTLNGVLNANASGFNCSAIAMAIPAGGNRLFITNSGAAVNVTGNLTMSTNSYALLGPGASLTVGSLIIDASTSSKASGLSTFTNNGGILTANNTTVNNNQGTGTGLLLINGGINNLGNTAVGRNNTGAAGATLGTEGLVINGGVVTMTNLNLGNAGNGNSSLSAYITGGIVTNNGAVFINQGSASRFSRLLQTGGLFVVPDPAVVNPNPTVSGSFNNYVINGGTNIVGGFYFGNTNGSAGTVNFTNAATIYIGSQGINWNGGITLNTALKAGGAFGATADWTGLTTLTLNGSGTFTIQAADQGGIAHNIALTGPVAGPSSIVLSKTGDGALTFNAANTYSGMTLINGGSLVLGAGGSLASTLIMVGPGSTFDVSAFSGAYTPVVNQTLCGFGSVIGAVSASSGTIQPGSNTVTGTLTFAGGLTESGTASKFILSNDPVNGGNDLISIIGDLTVSGANTITVVGSLPNNTNYTLMKYTGNFNGTVANFTLAGATGYLTNVVETKSIVLHTQSTNRGPATITWVGNLVNNFWDTSATTNWLNAGALDYFISSDTVIFNATGSGVTNVSLVGSVSPTAVVVDSTTNYFFTGNGSIDGSGGLTKTNSGTLTILTTNTYTGVTMLTGGALEVSQLADGALPSSIGAADSGPGSVVISNATFRYLGPNVSVDRGATFAGPSSAIDVSANGNLTLSGTLAGSGGLTKEGNGTLILSGGNTYAGSTTLSNGTLQINSTASALPSAPVVFAGGTLSLNVSGQETYTSPLNITNTGTLNSAGGNNNIVQGPWSGAGTLTLDMASGTFSINGNITTNFTGTILVSDSSAGTFRLNAGGGDPCTGSSLALFDLGNGSVIMGNRNGSTYGTTNYFLGGLAGGSPTTLRGALNTGTPNTYVIGDKNLSTIFKGTIANGSGGGGAVVSITKTGTGTLTLEGQNTFTGTTTVSNGILALATNPDNSSDGSLSCAVINVAAAAVFDVSGRSDKTLQLASGQQLRGRGMLNGILDTTSGGMVAPGGGPGGSTGTLTITNNINLGGTAWMKLNRDNTPNSDRLVSSLSTISYGGTLVVTNVGGRLQAGDTFTLFSGGGLSTGTFTLNLPNYYSWDTSNLGVNGSIRVTAVSPLPAITNVDFSQLSSGTITLNAVNGAPNAPVTVLTTTNLALPVSSWTTANTGAFDGSGNYTQSISVDPTLPQRYYLLQTY